MLRSTVATLLMLLAPGGAGAWQVGAPVGQSAAPSAAAHRLPSPRCQEEPFGATEPPEFPAKQFPECDFPGCDGNGRAIGGLGAIPLFEWWPIKAYRPCPKCLEKGIRYSRSGQSLDEIVFKKNPKGGYYGDD